MTKRAAAECFSLFIDVYQFQTQCHDSIPVRLSAVLLAICSVDAATMEGLGKEVHKALRVFRLTPVREG